MNFLRPLEFFYESGKTHIALKGKSQHHSILGKGVPNDCQMKFKTCQGHGYYHFFKLRGLIHSEFKTLFVLF